MKNYMADQGGAPQLKGGAKAAQRATEHRMDDRMHSVSGEPQGVNPRPTRGPLQDRRATPAGSETSGIERAMGAHADKVHPVGKKPR